MGNSWHVSQGQALTQHGAAPARVTDLMAVTEFTRVSAKDAAALCLQAAADPTDHEALCFQPEIGAPLFASLFTIENNYFHHFLTLIQLCFLAHHSRQHSVFQALASTTLREHSVFNKNWHHSVRALFGISLRCAEI